MLQFQLTDPEPMLFHNEAMVRDGEIVSIVTSGNYGHASRRRHRHGLRALPRRERRRCAGPPPTKSKWPGCATRRRPASRRSAYVIFEIGKGADVTTEIELQLTRLAAADRTGARRAAALAAVPLAEDGALVRKPEAYPAGHTIRR
jgi:hypothetical protein